MANEEFSAARCAVNDVRIAQLEKGEEEIWQEIRDMKRSHTKVLVWTVALLITALGALLANTPIFK